MALNDKTNIKMLNIKLFMHLPLMILPTIKAEVRLVWEIKYRKKKNLTNNYLKGIKQIRTVKICINVVTSGEVYTFIDSTVNNLGI
jgi:hypothetical protein